MIAKSCAWILICLLGGAVADSGFAAERKLAVGHVPEAARHLPDVGALPSNQSMRLAVGLPLRDPAGLTNFLAKVYDPADPAYRHFLAPAQFAERFGPTPGDYQKVLEFAAARHLTVAGLHANRLLIDLEAPVTNIETAFHVRLRRYRDPALNRIFFAPDAEPSVSADMPILDVSGLTDFGAPRPLVHQAAAVPNAGNGSGPNGTYRGGDFRTAYAPGVSLDGSGQMLGLVQFDGFFTNDIINYASQTGLAVVPLQTVLIDNFDGTPTGANLNNGEVSLDIELAMAMAPGLAKIIVYEGGPNGVPNDILNRMATDNAARQLSCSWVWGGGPSATTDQIFQQMAAQGQSFFCASGDSGAYTTGASSPNGVDNPALTNAPVSSPYVTAVGATALTTTGPAGALVSEKVWNSGGGIASGGGVSSYYSLPDWQQSLATVGNGMSATYRNVPDVAMVGESIYVVYGNGAATTLNGTSCAAPLWAGLTALVNQEAANYQLPAVGFINPLIYAAANSAGYGSYFHDTTNGNNFNRYSTNLFSAMTGYDLCTGLGSPAGQPLIDLMALGQTALIVSPATIFSAVGPVGGVFSGSNFVFTLSNAGTNPIAWGAGTDAAWLSISPTNGVLTNSPVMITGSLNAAASNLLNGLYRGHVYFSSGGASVSVQREIDLQINEPFGLTPADGFSASGLAGGPFNTNAQLFALTNSGGRTVNWTASSSASWLDIIPPTGTLPPGGFVSAQVLLNASANGLSVGNYSATVFFSNALTGVIQTRNFALQVKDSLLQNAGFESGNFAGWTQSGNKAFTSVVTNAAYVHSGGSGAQFGPGGTLGYLSQTLPTAPGQWYLLSAWLANPGAGTPNEVSLSWNGALLYDQTNLPAFAWTNLQFWIVAASTTSTVQFGFRNDLAYFGLDDVQITPLTLPQLQIATPMAGAAWLSWNSIPGLKYQLQYKTVLSETNWLNAGLPLLSTNATTSFPETNVGDASRFYRIVIVR